MDTQRIIIDLVPFGYLSMMSGIDLPIADNGL